MYSYKESRSICPDYINLIKSITKLLHIFLNLNLNLNLTRNRTLTLNLFSYPEVFVFSPFLLHPELQTFSSV